MEGECFTDEDCVEKYGEEAVCSASTYQCNVDACTTDEVCQAIYGKEFYCRDNMGCTDRGCSYHVTCVNRFGEGSYCDTDEGICRIESCENYPGLCTQYYGQNWSCFPDGECANTNCENDSYCQELYGQDGICNPNYNRCVVDACTSDESCKLYRGWWDDIEWFCDAMQVCRLVECETDEDCRYTDYICQDRRCVYQQPTEDGDAEQDEQEPDGDEDSDSELGETDTDGDEDGDSELEETEADGDEDGDSELEETDTDGDEELEGNETR